MKKDVSVTVTPNVGITVDPSSPISLKKNQDTIEWKSTAKDQRFTIVLPPGEPQVTCAFQGQTWICQAGPFSADTTIRNIKYDITAPNAPLLDPDIEVFP
jgi:hypothetical protein